MDNSHRERSQPTTSPIVWEKNDPSDLTTMALGDTPADYRNKVIDRLFGRMTAIYGSKWDFQFRSESTLRIAKQQWLDALVKWQLTTHQLGRVLDACIMNHPRPPSLGEFMQLAVERYIPAHKAYQRQTRSSGSEQEKNRKMKTGRNALKDITDMLNNHHEDNNNA